MKKSVSITLGLCMAASLVATKPASAAFTVGGENGWQLTTDGIVDVFATYSMTSPSPGGNHVGGLLDTNANSPTEYNQRFGIGVGLLPSVVAFNIKAPTTNGIDSTVRIGIYPSIQNGGNSNILGTVNTGAGLNSPVLTPDDRFSVGPNIDFREIFYTAKGKYGEILAGRALNLYQGKNILTDMTLLTAGTASGRHNTVTLGHIGSGYLYAGFGPQLRYTTPDFAGAKFAIAICEPYKVAAETAKTGSPRVEAELSYARTFGGGTSVQAWLSGLYQNSTRLSTGVARAGADDQSIGGAYGVGVGIKGLNLLVSGYGGRGLGMVSAQDGGVFSNATDSIGHARMYWGFLAQATYKINSSWMVGVNYGQNRQQSTDQDDIERYITPQIQKHESAVFDITYNLNSFTQFIAEYTYAADRWNDGAHQHQNQIAFGTMFYW